MKTLHTFGCSITQGFALPDVVRPITDANGIALTPQQIKDNRIQINWEDIHLYQPSKHAWPNILADLLGVNVKNYAHRGACFNQIARQCAVNGSQIQQSDTVIVMWTYLSRISMQWPARTSVPLCNVVDPVAGWRTRILPGFNKAFGLSSTPSSANSSDQHIHKYIHDAIYTYANPMSVYDKYYNSLVLQTMTDGFLRSFGARVIHLSVEHDSYLDQLESARQELDPSLRSPYIIPEPSSWYTIDVNHSSCRILHDPTIPPAENDMHPSVTHHRNFADHVYNRYFQDPLENLKFCN